ncbi:uncharacterized protein LOC125657908 isoform X2 [Ostrea edulis]|uniref:uncharacterized protein LOC125657908 isoform X2 n=1 Tax=Ostrea edulis TaxID=37623 RepID=UPI0024AEFF19|nr:uncharacterized protein LOC125657908 isoform X2 [Ostrea edulis]
MECMDSPKDSYCPRDNSCSHVGLNKNLVLLSFAVCFLIVWNISLQYEIYSVSVALNARAKNDVKKESIPNGIEDPENQMTRSKITLVRVARNSRRLRDRVADLEIKVRSLEAAIVKNIVHLTMSNNMNDTILYSRVNNIANCTEHRGCIRWDSPLAEFQYSFNYIKDGNNMPVAIKIRSPGMYTVYAQLAISGPDLTNTFDPIVGFEIVLLRGTNERILSKGLVTQDQRGRRYHNIVRRQHPVDTVLILGTFKFFCDDMLIAPQGGKYSEYVFHI